MTWSYGTSRNTATLGVVLVSPSVVAHRRTGFAGATMQKIEERDGGSEIYRERNQRYVAIKYSVRGRDLGGAVGEAIKNVGEKVQLPRGYHIDWEGEYESEQRAEARLLIIVPLTVFLIFIILYSMFRSFKWAILILVNVMLARIGGLLALLLTHTNFSVSSGVGFLALFGVSVQTGVIMLEYINQLLALAATRSRTPPSKEPFAGSVPS